MMFGGRLLGTLAVASLIVAGAWSCDDGTNTSEASGVGAGETPPCIPCRDFLTKDEFPERVCRGDGQAAVDDLIGCFCYECTSDCFGNACQGIYPTDPCWACVDIECVPEIAQCMAN